MSLSIKLPVEPSPETVKAYQRIVDASDNIPAKKALEDFLVAYQNLKDFCKNIDNPEPTKMYQL